jgi:UDP-hydrolysing UDP-N-acetyl-D-glucosamine 2-epimerase
MNKKICVVIASRANYGRVKSLLLKLKNRCKLQIILSASAILDRFGNIENQICNDGFKINYKSYMIVEGQNPITMSKSTGLAIIELSSMFESLKPDIVVTVGDRYETLATAVAASYMNIAVAHIQGGEVSGSIDESVRHAITKLSHIHFPATQKSFNRLVKLGENKKNIFNVGCPSIDIIKNTNLSINKLSRDYNGTGYKINFNEPYVLVLQHPVTTEYGNGSFQIKETLKAAKKLKMQVLWIWPNIDAGSDDISKELRIFKERNQNLKFGFYKNFYPEDYLRILNSAKCAIGNSSSFIREGSYLGVPSVNIGTRQSFREHGKNIITVDYNNLSIYSAITKQLKIKKYKPEYIFGRGDAGSKIAKVLIKINTRIQKNITY